MQSIELFTVPDVPECSVVLPERLKLIDAREVDGEIVVYYMDPKAGDSTVTLTWYVLGLGIEIPDAFPGSYYKSVEMGDGSLRFLFFKQNTKKRAPIIATIPGAKTERNEGGLE